MMRPSCTRTEPIGIPPSARPLRASSTAALRNGSIVCSPTEAEVSPQPTAEADGHYGQLADDLEHFEFGVAAAQLHAAERLHLERVPDLLERVLRNHDLIGFRDRRFQP